MCVALPGSVIEINGQTAVVDFNGNKVNAMTGLVDVSVGAKVLVHAGCIIQCLTDEEASDMAELFKDLNSIE